MGAMYRFQLGAGGRHWGVHSDSPSTLMAWLRELVPQHGKHLLEVTLPCCPSVTYFIDRPESVPHSDIPCPHGNFFVGYEPPR